MYKYYAFKSLHKDENLISKIESFFMEQYDYFD